MANVIEGLATRIERLPAELLGDAIKAFVVIAERNGGTMIRRKYQLTAKPTDRRIKPGMASVLMEGVPSGFWVWRETGTKKHEIKPRQRGKPHWKPGPLAGALGQPVWGPVIHPGITPGPMRWTKTVKEADKAIDGIWARALARRVA